MPITFDETNLLARVVGEANGLTAVDLKDADAIGKKALEGFKALHATGAVGFPDLPADKKIVQEILAFAGKVKGSYDTVCVVGIGGSALGAWALDCGLRGPHPVQGPHSPSKPRLVILDNVDPEFVELALLSMTAKKTLVVVIAKSGATAETVATFLVVKAWQEKQLGLKAAKARTVIVTSQGRGDLKVLATREGYQTFHIPENVGGRFSVFSAVGLVPAALIGIDIKKLLKGAAAMIALSWKADVKSNIALRAAVYHFLALTRKNKPMQVAFPYSNRLWGTAFWFRQLWAESLGKKKLRTGEVVHVGQTPIAALGTTDQHSQVQLYMEGPADKVFTFWAVKKPTTPGKIPSGKIGLEGFDYLTGQTLSKLLDAECRATAAALTESGRPNCTVTLDKLDAEHLGMFLQFMEFQTAFVGEMLNIDAFDQEGVELGKKFTFALMGRKGFNEFGDRFKAYEKARKG